MAVSATLEIDETVRRRRRDGRPVLPLGFGEAGLPVHPDLKAALDRSTDHNGYGPVVGIESLRVAAAGYWGRRSLPTDPDLVLAGPGSKPLLYALLQAIGGGVALPRPSWVSYAAQATLLQQVSRLLPTPPGEGGVPDPDLLAAAAVDARACGEPLRTVVLTLPDNPTGRLASPSVVRRVCRVAREHDLLVISDEIYRDLVHDPDAAFLSPAEVAPERTVVTTGLSKSLAVGGWRLGVARLPDSERGRALYGRLAAVASEIWSSAPQPVQHAAAWAFTEPAQLRDRVAASRDLHARVANAAADRLEAAGAALARPRAAFYLYPDLAPHRDVLEARWGIRTGPDLAAVLLDRLGVAVLPGAAFGDPETALRLRVCTSQLYGDDEARRMFLLGHADPVRVPWVAGALDRLSEVLAHLTAGG